MYYLDYLMIDYEPLINTEITSLYEQPILLVNGNVIIKGMFAIVEYLNNLFPDGCIIGLEDPEVLTMSYCFQKNLSNLIYAKLYRDKEIYAKHTKIELNRNFGILEKYFMGYGDKIRMYYRNYLKSTNSMYLKYQDSCFNKIIASINQQLNKNQTEEGPSFLHGKKMAITDIILYANMKTIMNMENVITTKEHSACYKEHILNDDEVLGYYQRLSTLIENSSATKTPKRNSHMQFRKILSEFNKKENTNEEAKDQEIVSFKNSRAKWLTVCSVGIVGYILATKS